MMNSVEYIKENLKQLSKSFPDTCFKYGFDENIKTHVIEITPQDHFYNMDELDQAWIPVSIDFMELFPKEEIVFVSSDSPLSLNNYEFKCNEQKESKLLYDFFGSLLRNPVELWYSNSIVIPETPNKFNPYTSNVVNVTDKPFEENMIDFDSNEFPLAA